MHLWMSIELLAEHRAQDNRRFVLALADGGRVEAVIYRGDSLCISAQVGCAVGCPFCASGAQGLDRPLRLEELKAQIEMVQGLLDPQEPGIARVTVSGVGEPLHNQGAVEALCGWCAQRDLPLSITTSGGPIRHLQRWICEIPHRGLTISVHAGSEAARAQMVPKGPALEALFSSLREGLANTSNARKKKIALAYLVIAGINDHDAEVDAFIERVQPLGLKTHLYRYNPVPTSDLRGVSMDRYHEIADRIRAQGIQVRRSSQARTRANGGCGTLIAKLRQGEGRRKGLPVLQAEPREC